MNYTVELIIGRMWIGIIVLSLAFGIWKALGLVFEGVAKERPLAKMRETIREARKKEFWPEVAGAIVGFGLAPDDLLAGIAFALNGVFFVILAKKLLIHLQKKLTEERRAGEVLLMYEIISIYTKAGCTLQEALNACENFVKFNRSALRKCLLNFNHEPSKALREFAKDVDNPEADILSGILQRAVVVGASKMADILSEESMTMERMRQMRIEQGLGAKAVVQTLYLILPGLALLGVTMAPIGYYIVMQIKSLHL